MHASFRFGTPGFELASAAPPEIGFDGIHGREPDKLLRVSLSVLCNLVSDRNFYTLDWSPNNVGPVGTARPGLATDRDRFGLYGSARTKIWWTCT